MSLNWNFAFTTMIQVVFLIEIIIAIRIYRKQRSSSQSRSSQNQSFILLFSHPQSSLHSTTERETKTHQPLYLVQLPVTHPFHPPNQNPWVRIKSHLFLLSVFLLTFLLINFLLRPYTNMWILLIFPVLIPLPFLILPSLFNLKSFRTLSCLLVGFGFGALFLL